MYYRNRKLKLGLDSEYWARDRNVVPLYLSW